MGGLSAAAGADISEPLDHRGYQMRKQYPSNTELTSHSELRGWVGPDPETLFRSPWLERHKEL